MSETAIQVSIVMTYYERMGQLQTTLDSFLFHGYGSDVEVVIADDGSVREPASSIDTSRYPFQVKILYFKPEDKWYLNACVPFNRAFAAAQGRIVIIQNAECFHHGNVVAHAREHVGKGLYLTYGCYSINQASFEAIRKMEDFRQVQDSVAFLDQPLAREGDDAWYNHSTHRPCAFHFCSAMLKEELDALGGFDERYADGQGFDDNEFLYRIRKRGLEVRIIDSPTVIHQWHYSAASLSGREWWMFNRNKKIFKWVTKRGFNYRLVMAVWGAYFRARGLFQKRYRCSP